MATKTYLFANRHPTAGLVFSGREGENKFRGFWSGGANGRFILRQLIAKYGNKEGIEIYTKYNQALLEVRDSGMIGKTSTGDTKKIGCIVLYHENGTDDNKVSLEQQGYEGVD